MTLPLWQAYMAVQSHLQRSQRITCLCVSERYREAPDIPPPRYESVCEEDIPALLYIAEFLGAPDSALSRVEVMEVNQSSWRESPEWDGVWHKLGLGGPDTIACILRKLSRAPNLTELALCWAVANTPAVMCALSLFNTRGTLRRILLGNRGIKEVIPADIKELMRTVGRMQGLTSLSLIGFSRRGSNHLPPLRHIINGLLTLRATHALEHIELFLHIPKDLLGEKDAERGCSPFNLLGITTLQSLDLNTHVSLVFPMNQQVLLETLVHRCKTEGTARLHNLRLFLRHGDTPIGEYKQWELPLGRLFKILADDNDGKKKKGDEWYWGINTLVSFSLGTSVPLNHCSGYSLLLFLGKNPNLARFELTPSGGFVSDRAGKKSAQNKAFSLDKIVNRLLTTAPKLECVQVPVCPSGVLCE